MVRVEFPEAQESQSLAERDNPTTDELKELKAIIDKLSQSLAERDNPTTDFVALCKIRDIIRSQSLAERDNPTTINFTV